jgi:hypothetical protein
MLTSRVGGSVSKSSFIKNATEEPLIPPNKVPALSFNAPDGIWTEYEAAALRAFVYRDNESFEPEIVTFECVIGVLIAGVIPVTVIIPEAETMSSEK